MEDLSKSVPFTKRLGEPSTEVDTTVRDGITIYSDEKPALAFDGAAVSRTAARIVARDLAKKGVIGAREAEGEANLEVIIGQSNLLPASFLPTGAQRARAVCKVETSGTDYLGRRGAWMGSGFLVSENILLTNYHVLNSAAVAANAVAIFNYEAGPDGKPLPTESFRANPTRLFLTSPVNDLDFAFVWLDGAPGKKFGFTPLTRGAFDVLEGQLVNIIQHPAGRMKELALQDNAVNQVDRTVIRYVTDTEPGSSGSCVYNNSWQPVALHHASRAVANATVNEGIRLTAIAGLLEQTAEHGTEMDAAAAKELLKLFGGTDETLGFFGTLGRIYANEGSGMEAVVNSFRGEANDIDVGFWNLEWFGKSYKDKTADVAEVMVKMNLDIWALVESSPSAAAYLVSYLADKYGLDFGFACSEPNAPDGKQSTTVIWNRKTVNGQRMEWPGEIDSWFKLTSAGHEPGDFDDLGLEAVDGKIFDRYPGLFYFEALNRDSDQGAFTFFLVPLHLKAMDEGSKRRQLASEILAAAVQAASRQLDDNDWVMGGDYNAELATDDFRALQKKGLVPISADDAEGGAFTYLKRPKSLIDHIFLSGDMADRFGADDYFIVAAEKTIPDYVKKLSDHRPVLVRLSLHDVAHETKPSAGDVTRIPESLVAALRELRMPAAKARTATA